MLPPSRVRGDLTPVNRQLNGQLLSALGPPTAEHGTARFRGHPDEKPMGALHFRIAEIRQCLFHNPVPKSN
jgi:hypothetical protein